ncbi:uncharacterized protein LOC105779007 [Gossypium raimondii]|uniref:uncharacterized protein LOC105779007 n=1 Tax=Gossypium raimondii TaxID=29730 RepID=UPI00063ADB77|nr:uncharacterized protein LOC105779007 [Gossypium raimondii]
MPRQNVQQSFSSSTSTIEDLLKDYTANNDAIIQSQVPNNKEHCLVIESSQSQGKEQCKAITLRSGTQLPGVVIDAFIEEESSKVPEGLTFESAVEQTRKDGSKQKHTEANSSCKANTNSMAKQPQQMEGRPLPPFPQHFQKSKQYVQFKKFLEVLKQLHINIPLVEALEQMPNYVKFMKDILSKKRRKEEFAGHMHHNPDADSIE